MNIVNSNSSHIKEIAKVHCSAFPHHLSSAMGLRFVCKSLTWYLEHPSNGFLLHLENDGVIIGYVTAFYNDGTLMNGSATTIGQYTFRTAMISFICRPWLIFHSEIRLKWKFLYKQIQLRFIKQRTLKTTFTDSNTIQKHFNKCGLLSIGVCNTMQGRGCGAILINAFEEVANKKFQVNHFELTVNKENIKAQKAYKKSGWQVDEIKGDYCYMYKNI